MTRNTRATGWVVGTVVLVLAIFAATWFLLAGPRFEAAAQTMVDVENAAAQNDLLAVQNAKLRSDFESLDQYKADLIVERDAGDPKRINALVPPDIVNQFRAFAAAIQFRL